LKKDYDMSAEEESVLQPLLKPGKGFYVLVGALLVLTGGSSTAGTHNLAKD